MHIPLGPLNVKKMDFFLNLLGSKTGDVLMYDIRSSKLLWKSNQFYPSTSSVSKLFAGAVKSLEFSDDSKSLYSSGISEKVCFWDSDNGRLMNKVENENCASVFCSRYESVDTLSLVALRTSCLE